MEIPIVGIGKEGECRAVPDTFLFNKSMGRQHLTYYIDPTRLYKSLGCLKLLWHTAYQGAIAERNRGKKKIKLDYKSRERGKANPNVFHFQCLFHFVIS